MGGMDDSAELAEDKPCAELVSVLFVRGWPRQRAGSKGRFPHRPIIRFQVTRLAEFHITC